LVLPTLEVSKGGRAEGPGAQHLRIFKKALAINTIYKNIDII